jgi:hypothetical protein
MINHVLISLFLTFVGLALIAAWVFACTLLIEHWPKTAAAVLFVTLAVALFFVIWARTA